jgi:predicted nucleic acid-binding protein
MKLVELVVDTNVASFIHADSERGAGYSKLIAGSCAGITMLSIAEFRAGVVRKNWGPRKIASLDASLNRYVLIEANSEIANVSGGILACSAQVGRALSWPDAWAAATALWLDVPLVTHDWDLEGIPGLQVLTIHQNWQVREEGSLLSASEPLWLGSGGVGTRYAGDRVELQ